MSSSIKTAQLAYVGFILVFFVTAGFFLGSYLDKRWHMKSTMGILGILFGAILGFLEIYRLFKRSQS